MRTRQEIETALDAGMLFVAMGNGKWWKARRNGKTQLWKTRPNDFRIPIKMGMKDYAAIDHNNLQSDLIQIRNVD